MTSDNNFHVGQIVVDITGQLNAGRPVTINAIRNNQVEVNWFEGDERISKIAITTIQNLKSLKNDDAKSNGLSA